MSQEMRDFAAAFNKGLDRGVGMYEKDQDRAIQREHNKLLRDQHEATERHNTRRDDIYAQQVTQAGETARMRAQAALNKASGKGGGGAAAAPVNPDKYAEGAAGVGLAIPKPQAPPAPSVTNIYQSTSDDADPGVAPPPPVLRKGGMVKKFADGGMTVAEALSYGPKGSRDKETTPAKPASAAGSAFSSAYEKSAAAYEKSKEKPIINAQPTGPVGRGAGGSYTTADVRPGGVLDTTAAGIGGTDYRRGGPVRRYAGGGSIELNDDMTGKSGQAAVAQMAVTPANKNPDGSTKTKEQEDDGALAKTARAASPTAPDYFAFAGGSADGATGSGGDSAGGVSGTGGVGGSASDSAGGSAAAGTSGDAGSDGSGTYRRGGRVRRFQSGGRVMEAIDTGTSGPGSGYGYRAAPPSRRY